MGKIPELSKLKSLQNNIGLGSFFHKIDPEDVKSLKIEDYIKSFQLFYTGRQALEYLIQVISAEKQIRNIWIPKYYCQGVTAWIKTLHKNIKTYEIYPFEQASNFNYHSFTTRDDIILLNNFSGIYQYDCHSSSDSPITIEDHSHGWLSNASLNSNADYCFASLRKTLPIPLGGIAWKPNDTLTKRDDFYNYDEEFYTIWGISKEAMFAKTFQSKTSTPIDKETFLPLFAQTEDLLDNSFKLIKPLSEHALLIKEFLNKDFLLYKKENLKTIENNLIENSHFKVLKAKNKVPFGLQLVFKEEFFFENLKTYLINHGIYPSFLWPNNEKIYDYHYLLNIHIDFRYSKDDIDYVRYVINNWTNLNPL